MCVHIAVLACLNDVLFPLENMRPLPPPLLFPHVKKMFVFDHIERVRARP